MDPIPPKFGERLAWIEQDITLPARELAKLDAMVSDLEKSVVLEIRKKHLLFEQASRLEEIAAEDPNPLRRRAASAELDKRARMASDVAALRANAESDYDGFMAIEDKGGIVNMARAWIRDISHGNFTTAFPSSKYADFHCGAELRAFGNAFINAHVNRVARIALFAGHRGTDMLRHLLEHFPRARTEFDVMKEMEAFKRHFASNHDIEKQAKLLVNIANAKPWIMYLNPKRSINLKLCVVEDDSVEVNIYNIWNPKTLIKMCSLKLYKPPGSDAVVRTLSYLLSVDVAKHPGVAKVVSMAIRRCIESFKNGKIELSQVRGDDLPLVAAKLQEWADREFAGCPAAVARSYVGGLFPAVKKSKRSSCGWQFVDDEKHPNKKAKM